jgi:hypothetical protein
VLEYAIDFAHAFVQRNQDLITAYLCSDIEASVKKVVGERCVDLGVDRIGLIDVLSGPITEAEVLNVVNGIELGEFVSITRFSGPQEEMLLRALWIERLSQPLMRVAHIVERKGAATESGSRAFSGS